ncbi:MAG: 4-(cytidine 5'-diphospho)-2-C-methyl-D-erythritol kinase [Actinomycetes bacterium]
MSPVRALAPAKLNLALAVGAPRSDGFHEVATVYHAVSLYDEVVASAGEGLTVTVDGAKGVRVDQVPTDGTNLAAQAALLLAEQTGQLPDVHLHIHKGIPVAGGMAGGSADAAAALVACDALWGTAVPRAELLELAARLGSDVPFSVVGGTALGLGRGEQLTPALARGRFEWVFALADGGLSTPRVYAETDRLRKGRVLPEPRVPDELMAALRSGDAVALGQAMHNDLQSAACSLLPALRQTLEVGDDCDALGAIVSGSGPTCAFLARDKEHSLDIAVALSASGTCRSVKRAHGPVLGARLGEEH